MPSVDTIPLPGQVLVEKYRIDRELGRGGMGVVLGAHHLHLDERVAIKFLLPELAHDAGIVARFLREGRAAVKIRSEHVVRVLDVSTMPGGTPFMVMEYLQGADLSALLAQQGRLPLATAVDFVLQGLEAIAEAHALGMVHRDLKPSNLFLVHRPDGTPCVKVLDFGITKVVASSRSEMDMTKTNAVMGSPRYMSPEQMRSTRTVDARSDVWALGVILHELLCGAPPFDAETMPELLAKILQDEPVPPSRLRSDVPLAIDHAIARCLQKDPGARFEHVGQLAQAIAPYGSADAYASSERIARLLSSAGPWSGPRPHASPVGPSQPPPFSAPNPAPRTHPTVSAWSDGAKPSRPSRVAVLAVGILFVACLGAGAVALVLRGGLHRGAATALSAAPLTTPPAVVPSASTAPLPPAVLAEPVASASVPATAATPAPSASASAASSRSVGPSATTPPARRSRPVGQPVPSPGNELFDGRR
jgi:serine/threonine-protein kinase